MIRGNELIDALRGLFESCQAFDTRRYEDCPSAGEIFAQLVPPIQDELDGALSLLGIILDHYEPLADAKQAADDAEEGSADESRARRVADLSFVARIELMQHTFTRTTVPPSRSTPFASAARSSGATPALPAT